MNPHFGWWASLLQDGTLLLIGASTNLYDATSGTWSTLPGLPERSYPKALLPDDTVLLDVEGPSCTDSAVYDPRTGLTTSVSSMLPCISALGVPPLLTPLLDGTILAAGGSTCSDDGVCVPTNVGVLYVPGGVPLPRLPAFPSPDPPAIPGPTPRPTPLPPAIGPVPPNARTWTITVDNRSSKRAALFVAEEGQNGTLQVVGSARPNVVPAGASVKVTFLFPAKGGPDGWIYVNPRPGEGGSLVHAADIGTPGRILVTSDGQAGWLSP